MRDGGLENGMVWGRSSMEHRVGRVQMGTEGACEEAERGGKMGTKGALTREAN